MPDGLEAERLFYAFRATLCCVFGAKCVHIAWIIRTQTQHDVFFIDWEQPKGGADDGETANADGSGGPGVSVWRSIFAANEWFKLQTERTVSLELSLVSLLFLLEGVGQLDYARLVPKTMESPACITTSRCGTRSPSSSSCCSRSRSGSSRWALWNRFVRDKAWQFVDLLAVSNVSMIVLEERASGYYLHGKSVHSHADTGMLELHRNLKRETDALAPRRGLSPRLRRPVLRDRLAGRTRHVRRGGGGRQPRGGGEAGRAGRTDAKGRRRDFRNSPEDVLLKHAEVNNFLTSFINGSLERHKLEVRPKTYGENLIGKPRTSWRRRRARHTSSRTPRATSSARCSPGTSSTSRSSTRSRTRSSTPSSRTRTSPSSRRTSSSSSSASRAASSRASTSPKRR